eukprot:12687239-Ditylum_brightwellii.AAC.1
MRLCQRGDPQKNGVVQKGASTGVLPLVFGGEGHWLVLHVDKGNTTCFLKGCNKAWNCFYVN